MFLSDKPIISLTNFSSVKTGISDALGSIIVCPACFANLYPSPVEPVLGYDLPPVHIITLSAVIDVLDVFTPFTAPSLIISDFTVSCTSDTFGLKAYFLRAFTTSCDLSLRGNTLPPLSTFVLTPFSSIIRIISSFVNVYSAEYKNFAFLGY